jgi:predicted peroxiredoxin
MRRQGRILAAMGGLFIVASTGPQDPTRASIPFHIAANGATPAGVECGVAFAGDAADLVKPDVIASVRGVGIPPLQDLMQKCVAQGVRFYV